jgi:hypothetical protein
MIGIGIGSDHCGACMLGLRACVRVIKACLCVCARAWCARVCVDQHGAADLGRVGAGRSSTMRACVRLRLRRPPCAYPLGACVRACASARERVLSCVRACACGSAAHLRLRTQRCAGLLDVRDVLIDLRSCGVAARRTVSQHAALRVATHRAAQHKHAPAAPPRTAAARPAPAAPRRAAYACARAVLGGGRLA